MKEIKQLSGRTCPEDPSHLPGRVTFGHIYCPECGKELWQVPVPTCPRCGQYVPGKFCSTCGAKGDSRNEVGR